MSDLIENYPIFYHVEKIYNFFDIFKTIKYIKYESFILLKTA